MKSKRKWFVLVNGSDLKPYPAVEEGGELKLFDTYGEADGFAYAQPAARTFGYYVLSIKVRA